jgi:HSP20 family protein
MATITRWNPFEEMLTLSAAMDRALEGAQAAPRNGVMALPLDLYETDGGYELRLAAPGLKADDFEITLHRGVLTVKGKTEQAAPEGARAHVRELRFGTFSRSVKFPAEVNVEGVTAALADGILTISVPKAEAAQPKKIAVQAS